MRKLAILLGAAPILFALQAQRITWTTMNEPGVGGAITAIGVSPHDQRKLLAAGDMLGAAHSENRGEFWEITTGFTNWELGEFTFHPENPQEIWVGTMSGPHVSRDGGRTWVLKRNGFPALSSGHYSAPIQKVVYDPLQRNRLLAFGGSHRRWSSPGRPLWGVVWESLDGGESWRTLTTIGDGVNITSVAMTGGILYVSTYGKGVFRSDSGGAHWTECGAGLPHGNVYQIAIHPQDANIVWAALDNQRDGSTLIPGSIYKTVDSCSNWSESGEGLPRRTNSDVNQMSRHFAVAVAPSNPQRLYTADRGWSTSSLWRSDDGGGSWRPILDYGNRGRWPMPFNNGPTSEWITVDPVNPDIVYFGNQANLIRTMDGGETFEDLGSILVSAERKQWRGRGFSGLVSINFRFNPWHPGRALFNAMDDGKVWVSDDDLETWWYAGPGVPPYNGGNDAVFAGVEGSVIYTTFGQDANFRGLAKSEDGGRTWTMLSGAARGFPEMGAANGRARGVYAMAEQPDRAWVVIGNRLYATNDGGKQWAVVLEQPGLSWLAGSGSLIYASAASGIFRSEDGRTFSLMDGSPTEAWRITLDPRDPQTVYVTKWRKTNGGLWRFRDGQWSRLHTDTYIYDVDIDPHEPSRIAVCTSDDPYRDISGATGVHLSEDGGATWSIQNQGLAMLRAAVIRFDPHQSGRLVLGTSGRGYFVGRLNDPGAAQAANSR